MVRLSSAARAVANTAVHFSATLHRLSQAARRGFSPPHVLDVGEGFPGGQSRYT